MKKCVEDPAHHEEWSSTIRLRWSDVLESAFDYYYSEYVPAWALNETQFNNIGDKVFIWKKDGKWVKWEEIALSQRPDVGTIFDLLPDLPGDNEYWTMVRGLENNGIKEPEDYFWENIFSYKHIDEVEVNKKRYKIEWEA